MTSSLKRTKGTVAKKKRLQSKSSWSIQLAGPLLCLFALIGASADAGARRERNYDSDRSHVVTQYSGDRVVGYTDAKSAPKRSARLRIDKRQQYVKPKQPSDKLVTREAYEAKNGVVRSAKTGATARGLSPKYAAQFQAFIDDLENNHGATIKFMGGYRAGRCGQANKHSCGMALDYCQYARGVVEKKCNLPGRVVVAQVAKAHGLFEGGQWCNHDYGHVEAGGSAACGQNFYAAVAKFKAQHDR